MDVPQNKKQLDDVGLMICPQCSTPMYVDTWEGWIWKCPMCDHYGRIATQEESDLQEKENAEYLKGLLQNNAE